MFLDRSILLSAAAAISVVNADLYDGVCRCPAPSMVNKLQLVKFKNWIKNISFSKDKVASAVRETAKDDRDKSRNPDKRLGNNLLI